MASGTPVVTSNVSSLPEVAGDAAVLVDPYDVGSIVDGMRRVLDRSARWPTELRRKGLARAREFSWERSVGKTQRRLSRSRCGRARLRDGASAGERARVALVHDWLTGMRGGEKVLEALCELYPDADIFTLFHVPGSVSPTIERHRIRTSFVQQLPFAATQLPPLPAALPVRDRAVRPRRLRPGDQLEPLRGQGGRRARARAAHLLLPFADALCVGSVRRVLRAGAGRARSRAAGSIGRCWRGWRGGMRRRRRACTASSPTRNTLPAGSADTIIARRRSCIRLSTRSSSSPTRRLPESHFLIVSALVPVQADRPGDRRVPPCRARALRIVGDGPDRAAARAARRTGTSTFLGRADRRRDPRRVPARARGDPAGRRGLRHRAGRSAGVRAAGRRARRAAARSKR